MDENDAAFSAGGSGAVLIDGEEKAKQIATKIEKHFQASTVSGSVTTVVVSPEQEENEKWFGARMKRAIAKMQRTKAAKANLISVPLEPYMQPCKACGVMPAEKRFNQDATGDLLCLSCVQKRDKGLQVRRSKEKGYAKRFYDYVKQNYKNEAGVWDGTELAEDLTRLAALDASGYIGFISMDGNNMGTLLENIDKKDAYKKYSETLKETVEHLVYDAIVTNAEPINGTLPFEVVLIGGDDVMIFTTAKLAMPLALAVLKGFEESSYKILDAGRITGKARPEKLSMCASVVYAHGNFPIRPLVELGESLLKNAKKYAESCGHKEKSYGQQHPKPACSAIDFLLISGSMADLDTIHANSRFQRPFTLADMQQLLTDAGKLKIAHSQLQRVYEACVSGRPVQATLATLRLLGRLRDAKQREHVKAVIGRYSELEDKEKYIFWPWTRLKEKRASIMIDLIELQRFAKVEDERNGRE